MGRSPVSIALESQHRCQSATSLESTKNAGQEFVDLGIGMRPDLTGNGLGSQFLAHVLQDVTENHPSANIRLTVATFNQRAIKLYHRFAFHYEAQFEREGVVFQTMKRPV